MGSGLYAACAALMARTQALDLMANNLANLNTTGFRGSQPFYQALQASSANAPQGALTQAVNDFAVLAGRNVDLQTGAIESTGNPLDVAIQGPAFLAVQAAGSTVYTRAGNLTLGTNGTLETETGDPVLDEGGNPIVLPAGEVAISNTGTISVNNAVVGKLQLAEFAPGTALTAVGNSYFSAPDGSAQPATGSSLVPGSLESSNVNAVQAGVDLVELERHADMMERAMKLFNSDFDQTGASLGKV